MKLFLHRELPAIDWVYSLTKKIKAIAFSTPLVCREYPKFYPAFIRDIVSFPTFRSRLTREARTTAGNYNINTQGLKSLKFICPPRDKQNYEPWTAL
ncbi:MAG: hypothetical protein QNJ65_07390 [Xenococcaceae cyanobacterium MO_234.B1]|nr:hypothetical protein [Xenococcaceae cyanobacterium MO_234.B1]